MKKLILFILTFFLANASFSAYLKNVPIDLIQPDGVIIHCFVTGDEFHRRVHDKENFTIIQDAKSGYYVYAILEEGLLKPSSYIVGRTDPSSLPIQPGIDIPVKPGIPQKSPTLKAGSTALPNSTKGNFNNIVISIRFSDQSPTTLTLNDYQSKFNSDTNLSLKSYFKEVSNSQLNVTSHFFPLPQGQTIPEYQDSHPRAYYLRYNAVTNPIGYKEDERYDKEIGLIKNAIDFVTKQIIDSQTNFDLNNDGFIDNLIVILQGSGDGFGDILYPMSIGLNNSQIMIGNKQFNQFNKQLSSLLDAPVISHEFFHALGAPDLYHYSYDGKDPVGAWDLMAAGPGEHMTTYMKWKYGKWFDKLPEITQPGSYTLLPVSKSPFACYKIPSPDNPNEYFVVEYRKREGLLESALLPNYGEGLIIYRINTKVPWGNAAGPPDEIYVYRADGTPTATGDISKAAFSSNSNRTAFNSYTNPYCFLSDGKKGWIDISNISVAGTQINFTVNSAIPLSPPSDIIASSQNNQVVLKWKSPAKKDNTFIGYNVYLAGKNTPLNTTIITDTTFITPVPGNMDSYTYTVTAKYQQGESDPVFGTYINFASPSVKDSLALVALYKECDGPNWRRKTNWLTGPINSWEAVKVEKGRVVELTFCDWPESDGLKGQLPAEISNLTEIRYLLLTNNQLTGTLPDSWVSLKKLDRLWLNLNKFSGPLPDSWSSLVNIKHIWINTNQFSGQLPLSWAKLVNLELLNLAENNFSGTLPESWSAMVNMADFSLNANKLTGTLPESWSSMVKLDNLALRDNQFSGTLPDTWSSFKVLRQFQLDNNQFVGPIPASWASMTNLQFFTCEQNQITRLPDMSLMTKLNYLRVGNNSLDFGTIEPNIGIPKAEFSYQMQASVGKAETLLKQLGEECRLSISVGGKSNNYQWFKKGTIIPGATRNEYVIPSVTSSDAAVYTCQITNSVVTLLTLQSNPITLQILGPVANAGNISGISTVCLGQNSVVYTVPAITNATSYVWTLPSGATGTSTTNSISVNYGTSAISGVITVKGRNSIGDGASSSLTVTVNSIPDNAAAISGTSSVCQGQNSVTYTVPDITRATSYIWTVPTGATGSSTTNSITVNFGTSAVSGNITVKGHSNCGDGVASILPIKVNPIPATPIITLNGNVLHSNATIGNQWYYQNNPVSGATTQDYTATDYGNYSVKVTQNGCVSLASEGILTAIDSYDNGKEIKIYPNPVSDNLTIEYNGNKGDTRFEIYNSAGQLITSGILLETTIVNASLFSSGVYTIKFNTGKTFEFRKVIKQK